MPRGVTKFIKKKNAVAAVRLVLVCTVGCGT